jgi:hypothetical protein
MTLGKSGAAVGKSGAAVGKSSVHGGNSASKKINRYKKAFPFGKATLNSAVLQG